MEYANNLSQYAPAQTEAQVAEEVARIREVAVRNHNVEVYKFCYSTIDLTTLSCNDSVESVTEFTRKAVEFYDKYPHIPNVASICIYPAFVETVGLAAGESPMRITSVTGGFPASQTYIEVKALETAMAVENGADEIDIVMNVGKMLTGAYDEAANEVEILRGETQDVVLKV
ncbi:MAG: deoxyribose-phosphate aldolase, partial [Alistipes sp.]|nr:deoxyribose-phosphate aldolase [Alistipes sp.]